MQHQDKEKITLSIDHVQLVAKAVRKCSHQPLQKAFEKYIKLLCAENFDQEKVIKAQTDFAQKAGTEKFSLMMMEIFKEKYKEQAIQIWSLVYVKHLTSSNVMPLKDLIISTWVERKQIFDETPAAEEVWDLLNEEPLPPLATSEEYKADFKKLAQAVVPDSPALAAGETSLDPLPLQNRAAAFKKIYTALYEGQSRLFKINFLEEAQQKQWSDKKLLKKAAGYAQAHPNSRVAHALKLTEKFKDQNIDENNIKLFFKIYKWSFKNSHWFAISNLFSTPIYFFSSLKNKARELKTNEEKDLNPKERFAKIEEKIKTKSNNEGFDKTRTGKIHAALSRKK